MKVLRIIARLNVGGPARHVSWVTAGVERAGHESVLVAGVVPPGEDDMSYFAAELGVVPVIIPEMSREVSPKDAITVWKLYRLFQRERPDIVHTHTAKAGTVGRVAGIFYRWLTLGTLIGRPRACRFVHTYHGHIFHSYYGAFKTRIFLLIERLLARIATDRIIVISPQQYREIHEHFGVGQARQFSIVPLGLDVHLFDQWRERRRAVREELGASEHDMLVGIVGRLTEIKNHELFLRAAAMYREIHGPEDAALGRHMRFVLIGDGHLRQALEIQALSLGLTDDVKFMGLRDDPENFYPALDIVALTSRNEGTPLTLIEAMANARPLIATAAGGVVDLLGETVAKLERYDGEWRLCERGVLVERDEARALADGLAYLVEHEGVRFEMGERARQFVERKYSKERLIADVLNIYSELLRPDERAERIALSATQSDSGKLGTARMKGE